MGKIKKIELFVRLLTGLYKEEVNITQIQSGAFYYFFIHQKYSLLCRVAFFAVRRMRFHCILYW